MMISKGQGVKYTFYKPLFFEFPDDVNAFNQPQYNIMLGSALKLGVLTDKLNQNQTNFYYPAGTWCNIFDPERDPCFKSTGQSLTKSTLAYEFYLSLREGFIIPFQDVNQIRKSQHIGTTKDLQNQPIDFYALLDSSQGTKQIAAMGYYYNDDGVSIQDDGNSNYYLVFIYNNLNSATDQDKYLSIEFSQVIQATNFKKGSCYAVNHNDWLQNFYIFNADALVGESATFKLFLTVADQPDPIEFGQVVRDTDKDQLIAQLKNAVCMSTIVKIQLMQQPSQK